MLQSTISIEAHKALSMAKHTRGQGSHLSNETKTSVPLWYQLKAWKYVKTQELFRPQIKDYGSIDFTLTYTKSGIE